MFWMPWFGSVVSTLVQPCLAVHLMVPRVEAGAAVGHLGCPLQGTISKLAGGLSDPCMIHQSQSKVAETPSLNPLAG